MSEETAAAPEQAVDQSKGFGTGGTGLDIAEERRNSMNISSTPEVELPKPTSEIEAQNNFEVPEKFKDKSLEDVIKSYSELEKKLGSTQSANAPENYEIALSEELEKSGFDFNLDDPVLNKFSEIARDTGMSNEKFNELLDLYGKSFISNYTLSEDQVADYRQQEMAKLGDEAPAIVEQLKTWGKNNLSESEYNSFIQFGDTSDNILLLQKLMNNSSVPTVSASGSNLNYTRDDLKTMMADKRYAMDMNYTHKVDQLFAEVYKAAQ